LDCPGFKSDPANNYCNAKKSKITRDTIRLGNLNELAYLLQKYYLKQSATGGIGDYPRLEAGSYIKGLSTSLWPESWQKTANQTSLPKQLNSSLPLDPLNAFNLPCLIDEKTNSFYDQATCWSENNKEFKLPAGSRLYIYKYLAGQNNYLLCANLECRLINETTGEVTNENCPWFIKKDGINYWDEIHLRFDLDACYSISTGQ
ncbi:MAG: hypothetical protein V1692_02125, partial [bacterium]